MKKSYENAIKEVLSRVNKNDCWGWEIKEIKENSASFSWGYLKGENEALTLTIIEKGIRTLRTVVVADIPNSTTGCLCYAGKGRWDDVETVEEGITLVLNEAIRMTKGIF